MRPVIPVAELAQPLGALQDQLVDMLLLVAAGLGQAVVAHQEESDDADVGDEDDGQHPGDGCCGPASCGNVGNRHGAQEYMQAQQHPGQMARVNEPVEDAH